MKTARDCPRETFYSPPRVGTGCKTKSLKLSSHLKLFTATDMLWKISIKMKWMKKHSSVSNTNADDDMTCPVKMSTNIQQIIYLNNNDNQLSSDKISANPLNPMYWIMKLNRIIELYWIVSDYWILSDYHPKPKFS